MTVPIRSMPDIVLARFDDWDGMVEALRAAKAHRSLSDNFCDDRAGLARGHTNKVLGPSRDKNLSMMTFDTFAELFAVQFFMAPNPAAEARMIDRWEGRDISNVRVESGRISQRMLERAKPLVLRQSGQHANGARNRILTREHKAKIASKAGKSRWRKHRKTMRERLQERRDKKMVPEN